MDATAFAVFWPACTGVFGFISLQLHHTSYYACTFASYCMMYTRVPMQYPAVCLAQWAHGSVVFWPACTACHRDWVCADACAYMNILALFACHLCGGMMVMDVDYASVSALVFLRACIPIADALIDLLVRVLCCVCMQLPRPPHHSQVC
jgi:hypothetical protein